MSHFDKHKWITVCRTNDTAVCKDDDMVMSLPPHITGREFDAIAYDTKEEEDETRA